jgi:hypothetical protein
LVVAALGSPGSVRGEPKPSECPQLKLPEPRITTLKAGNAKEHLSASGGLIERGNGSKRIAFRLTCGGYSRESCRVALAWTDGESMRAELAEGVWTPEIYKTSDDRVARVQTARLTLEGPSCATQEMHFDLRGDKANWKVEYVVTGTEAPCEVGKRVYDLHPRYRPTAALPSGVLGCAIVEPDEDAHPD